MRCSPFAPLMMLSLLWASSAAAYTLPASYLFGRYFGWRDKDHEAFEIDVETRLLGPEYEGGEQTVEERWSLQLPLKFRSEQELPQGTRILVVSRGKRLLLEPGKPLVETPAMFDPLINLFTRATVRGPSKTFKASDLLLSDLNTAGVDTKTTGMTRVGEHVAVTIGAKEGEREKTQIWVDQERFVPLRYLQVSGDEKQRHFLEVRYLEYPGIGGKHRWLPRKIEIWQDGRPVQVSEIKVVRTPSKIDRSRFDLEVLRRQAHEQSTTRAPAAESQPAAAP